MQHEKKVTGSSTVFASAKFTQATTLKVIEVITSNDQSKCPKLGTFVFWSK